MNSTPLPLLVCLDNLRSAYNVGSIFRTSDAVEVKKLFLCGVTPIPPHPKLSKTALGSLGSVPWEHHCETVKCLTLLKSQNFKLIALETGPQTISLFKYTFNNPSCLIFGNEVSGLNKDVLRLADAVISIPQLGQKESLNVASAAAVAVYEFRRQNPVDRNS